MKFDFSNSNGEKLSGRLELPVAEPRAFAIFAHCFTCSKNTRAASFISCALAAEGIAVLRFDFTGLGNSDGDFSNTNFSSNVQDLLSAFEALKNAYETPKILIGHSLGGAAVLSAAAQINEIESVVTIGAPSCTGHVAHLFDGSIDEIKESGSAEVDLMGRKFTIKEQFIKDIKEADVLKGVSSFKKNLLILHSPIDDVVSIDHAAEIYQAAKHPKSFISLDDADHLISDKNDANYIANLIASWTSKHLPLKKKVAVDIDGEGVLVKSRNGFKFTQDVYTENHHILMDEPLSVKGDDLGMTPYELLLASLGGCTSMTLRMYADRKGLPLEGVSVELCHKKIDAADGSGRVDVIQKGIEIHGDELTEEQRKKLFEIAEKCPVNKTLKSEVIVESIKLP